MNKTNQDLLNWTGQCTICFKQTTILKTIRLSYAIKLYCQEEYIADVQRNNQSINSLISLTDQNKVNFNRRQIKQESIKLGVDFSDVNNLLKEL